MALIPFWKDKIITITSTTSVLFAVSNSDTSETIYTGRAYPTGGKVNIKVNDVCYNWYRHVLPTKTQSVWAGMTHHPAKFQLDVYDEEAETWGLVEAFEFLDDWSYDPTFVAETSGVCFPINGRIDSRMPVPFTATGAEDAIQEDNDIECTLHYTDGSTDTDGIGIYILASPARSDWDTDLAKALRCEGYNSVLYSLSAMEDPDNPITQADIEDVSYKVVTSCAKYAIYYVNAYGGWDAFLIEGESLVSDASGRETADLLYDNRVVSNRGRSNYVNELTRTYTLHTGFLSDAEAARMHHLFNSTQVYLRDIPTGTMIPVVMETSQCDYKTFRNQGRTLVRYDIVVSDARSLIRR